MGITSGGMCAGLPRGDICARDMSLRRSTCFPAFRAVTALSCSQARFSVHDPGRKSFVCHSWALLVPQLLQATWFIFSVFRILQALEINDFGSLEEHFSHLGSFLKDPRARTASPATSLPPACRTSGSILFYSTFPPLGLCPGLV